jgi:Flp pilus assembly protein TadG
VAAGFNRTQSRTVFIVLLDGFSEMPGVALPHSATIDQPKSRGSPMRCRPAAGKPAGRECGAVAVEFALVAWILVMIVFGAISLGIVFTQKVTLGSAVRDGARFGSVNIYEEAAGSGRTCQDVLDQTNYNVETIGMSDAQVVVVVKRGENTGTLEDSFADAIAVCGEDGSGSTSSYPCEDAGDIENLYVRATFDSSINIPFVSTRTVTLTSTGVYRCEYN